MFHRPHYYNKKLLSYLKIKQNTDEILHRRYYDIAAASQFVFEDIYFHLLNSLFKKSKNTNLVISGGSALNSLANGKVLEKPGLKIFSFLQFLTIVAQALVQLIFVLM